MSRQKIKKTQSESPCLPQPRDLFQTPAYATELLIPFIPKHIEIIWECAAGNGKMVETFFKNGFHVWRSDIDENPDNARINFLFDLPPTNLKIYKDRVAIITNPPFSIKYKFIEKAIDYEVPFAFLIPFDMCNQLANLFTTYNCQGVIPNRRIDFITPTGKTGENGSAASFHSFWLTRYFNLPHQLTFTELTNEMKKNI